jgi:predicted dehydrogenase
MKFLLLGASSIARRRVIPALVELPEVSSVDVATRRLLEPGELPAGWSGRMFTDYATSLRESGAEAVYVSLINSLHEKWAEAALLSGRHVVVDKPACLSLSAAERLLELAELKGLCLAEATVFEDHPQVGMIRSLLAEPGRGPTRLVSLFSFPPLLPGNFRNFSELGGGALYDLGSYAAAAGRLVFGDKPEEVICRLLSHHPETGVETAFSVLMRHPRGRCHVGFFGFDTEYQNRLVVSGPAIFLTVDRIFTTPPDLRNTISLIRGGERSAVACEAGDAFQMFLRRVVFCIQKREWRRLAEAMHADASVVERLRLSSRSGLS